MAPFSPSSSSCTSLVARDLKNFLGLGAEGDGAAVEALKEVKEAEPHFPTTPADFVADTERPEINISNNLESDFLFYL